MATPTECIANKRPECSISPYQYPSINFFPRVPLQLQRELSLLYDDSKGDSVHRAWGLSHYRRVHGLVASPLPPYRQLCAATHHACNRGHNTATLVPSCSLISALGVVCSQLLDPGLANPWVGLLAFGPDCPMSKATQPFTPYPVLQFVGMVVSGEAHKLHEPESGR